MLVGLAFFLVRDPEVHVSSVVYPVRFEIHSAGGCQDQGDNEQLPWRAMAPPDPPPPFTVTESDGLVWATLDPSSGQLERVESREQATLSLRVARRKLNAELVLIALREPVLVNGIPAPPLMVLAIGDSVVLGPGRLAHITERVVPFVGRPAGELIGRKCAHCRIPASAETRVVTHRCGALYHCETAESHPEVSEGDRLNCYEKVSACLSCKRELTQQPYLAWDPRSL